MDPAARSFKQLDLTAIPTRGARLVLAEDYDDARDSLVQLLGLLGYDVVGARDGAEALAIIDACAPKAVIADIEMPGMDGLRLAREIRQRYGSGIRLIALTGIPVRRAWTPAMNAGFDYYLMKPIEGEQLIPYIEGSLDLA